MLGAAQQTVTSSRSFTSAVRGQNVYSVILEPVEYDKNSDKRLGRNDLQKLTKSFYQAIDKDSKYFAVKKTVAYLRRMEKLYLNWVPSPMQKRQFLHLTRK